MSEQAVTRGRRPLVLGITLIVLAVVALAVPIATTVIGQRADFLDVDPHGTQALDLRPHTQYGVYLDDSDNSGYSVDCSATGEDGRELLDDDVPVNLSFSAQEYPPNLDFVFDSGSGRVEMTCDVSEADVLVRALPAGSPSLPIGLVAAAALGSLGACLLASLVRAPATGPDHRPAVVGAALVAVPWSMLGLRVMVTLMAPRVISAPPDDVLILDEPSPWDRVEPVLADASIAVLLGALLVGCWAAARRGRLTVAWALAVVMPTLAVAAVVSTWF